MGKEQISFFKRLTTVSGTPTKTAFQDLENKLLSTWILEHYRLQGSIITVEHDEGKIGFCCIDLNQPIEIEKIQSAINAFLQENPATPLMMLGTVQYCTSKFPAMQKLSQLPLQGISKHVVVAHHDMNSDLRQQVEEVVKQQQLANKQRLSLWSEAKIKYAKEMGNLSPDKKQKLQAALEQLEESIINGLDKEKSITDFIANTQLILEEEAHPFLNIVLKVAAIAIITLFAGAIGYGVGLTLCSCYPALFIAPFLGTAETALPTLATTTAFPSVISAGVACDGLFKPKAPMPVPKEVHEVTDAARSHLQSLF
ncbi:TPA: hypothetical protein ACPSKB_002445 [Legionella feeleii]